MNSYFIGFIFCLALALMLFAIIYLPYFSGIRRRAKAPEAESAETVKGLRWPPLRHVVNAAFILYMAVLAFVVFFLFYSDYQGEMRYLSLLPFSEVAKVYMMGKTLVSSQYVLNILLFVPLGLSLPIVFPKRMGRLWQTALFSLCLTVFIELLQYFIGRSADIDDIIANFIGGLCGYALYCLLLAILYKTRLRQRLLPGAARPRPAAMTLLSLLLALVIAAPPVLDALNAKSEYGLFRYNYQRIPAGAVCTAQLSEKAPEGGAVYANEELDEKAFMQRLTGLFCPDIQLESFDSYDPFNGRSVRAYNEELGVSITTYQSGMFFLTVPTGDNDLAELDDEQLSTFARGLAGEFLREGETLSLSAPERENGECVVTATYESADPAVYISGNTRIFGSEGELSIGSTTIRCNKQEEVALISPAEALKASHGLAVSAMALADCKITGVELTMLEVSGKQLPTYHFSGSARLPGGEESMELEFFVEAIRR